MNTHRCYLGAATAITCWVRNDAGRRDLSSPAVATVYVYPYGSTVEAFTIAAVTTSLGKITFTVTAADAEAYLTQAPYRFAVVWGTEQVYSGLLEAV